MNTDPKDRRMLTPEPRHLSRYLPTTINQAYEDLAGWVEQPGCFVDMDNWVRLSARHDPALKRDVAYCTVCLAGAWLAGAVGLVGHSVQEILADPDLQGLCRTAVEHRLPKPDNGDLLLALDAVRRGEIAYAVSLSSPGLDEVQTKRFRQLWNADPVLWELQSPEAVAYPFGCPSDPWSERPRVGREFLREETNRVRFQLWGQRLRQVADWLHRHRAEFGLYGTEDDFAEYAARYA